jgi:DME family drug/metabolite transporter
MVSFGSAALILLVCALGTTQLALVYPAWSWVLLVYLGCVQTPLAYVLFQAGMRSTPATLTSILTLSEPLAAAVLAWVMFGERLGPLGFVGGLLLIGTLLLLAF